MAEQAPKMFITGVGGMAGRHLAQAAVEAGYKVTGAIHENKPPEIVKLERERKLDVYPLELTEIPTFLLAMCQPDVIVHLAGHGIDNPQRGFEIFVDNTVLLNCITMAALKQKNKPRFIHASSISVYGKQVSPEPIPELNWRRLPDVNEMRLPYRGSKLSQERFLDEVVSSQDPSFEYIVARPSQHTGPGRKPGVVDYDIALQVKKILAGGEPIIKVRNKIAEVDMLDARDVALAYLVLATKGLPGERYNVVSQIPTTIEKLCQIMLESAGINQNNVQIQSTQAEETTYARYSNKKLRELGWEPKYTITDAVQRFWNWFIDQPEV